MECRLTLGALPSPALQSYVPALKGVDITTAEPVIFPDTGIWHPLAPMMYEDLKEYLNWWVQMNGAWELLA